MIPALKQAPPTQDLYLDFLKDLTQTGFKGEICPDYANRTVLATDNSIYQVLPQGVVYPQDLDDLCKITELASQDRYHKIVLSPRGGGTGTNGQSLSDGVVVDTSRHMNKILEINQAERWVRVQCGVVKDQLNHALKPYGLFFAPELSTSNRATIGGMINTDASGQGSCLYGKTRDHVLNLTTVLMDGSVLHSHPLTAEQQRALSAQQDRVGLVHRLVNGIHNEHKEQIASTFPKLNRCLTGYDLAHIRTRNNELDLNSVLCGSEGTLGFIAEARLNLLPIPKHSCLVVVKYGDFNAALRDASRLMKANPTSIETIDSKVLNLAMNDIVWLEVEEFFPHSDTPVKGINLVEYTADDEDTLRQDAGKLTAILNKNSNEDCLGHSLAWGSAAVNRIWGMRKKAVGLLGNSKGEARPIPFVEDTAVPPEHLADFIFEFRQLLDSHNLDYGMFGHVDAGVLHVRPAIDMKDPLQAKMVRVISDEVAALTKKYHGLLWGEHGKGVRSEYAPEFFGSLYPQLQRIKAAFDPHNQLNPGKIATPDPHLQLLKIDEVTTRGELDRTISLSNWQSFAEAVYCNGNGACFNWNFNDAMCPSWKATRERIHSPKGRASLIREWLTQLSAQGVDAQALLEAPQSFTEKLKSLKQKWQNTRAKKHGEYDFSHEVMESMAGCLACKSCAGQCPIKVDVPTFRSKFLALYYTRYMRPLKDYLVGSLEYVLPIASHAPGVYNFAVGNKISKKILSGWIGFEDSPLLPKTSLAQYAKNYHYQYATQERLNNLTESQKKHTVVIVQDAFTSFFEPRLVADYFKLLKMLGFKPLLAPFARNGKPLHVHGFLDTFKKTAQTNAEKLKKLADCGVPLIGLDPAMTLTYRSEYRKTLPQDAVPEVLLIQEWLAHHMDFLRLKQSLFKSNGKYRLMPHCTEKTNAAASISDWKKVFDALGQQLEVVNVGCCGMSGTYGHESANRKNSAVLFEQSWKDHVNARENYNKLAASGYSCRSQTKREAMVTIHHPVQLLLQAAAEKRLSMQEGKSETREAGG